MGQFIFEDDVADVQGTAYVRLGNTFENSMTEFSNSLETACSEAVTEGDFHDNLLSYSTRVKELSGEFSDISATIQKELQNLKSQVAAAD